MTPRRTAPFGLTLDNKTGNGSPAIEDLIAVQTAILQSNAEVLGTVKQFRTGIDQRLDRQLGEITGKLDGVVEQLDGVCEEVSTIKTERRVESALAVERTEAAKRAAEAEAAHASIAREERHDQSAVAEQHVLSWRWRVGIAIGVGIAAFAQIVPFIEKLWGLR